MKTKVLNVGFAAGEISPQFFHRVDLEKYSIGAAKIENYVVDFRGALKGRSGLLFMDFARGNGRLIPFYTGPDSSDVLCVLSDSKMSFMQDGRFLLEATKSVTAVAANVLTSAAHGYAVGDLVYLVGTTLPVYVYEITATTTNTFTVAMPHGLVPSNSGVLASATAARVFTIATPWTVFQLASLAWHQYGDELIFTIESKASHRLTVGSPFTLSEIDFSPAVSPVTSITATPSSAGSARMLFAVTTVDAEGAETTSPTPVLVTGSVNYTATAGSMALSWAAVSGAVSYRVYRSIITENTALSRTQPLGFIGETRSPSFVDNNIAPDYTRVPLTFYDPFEDGAVLYIQVTAGGSGYTSAPSVAVASGTGFQGYTVVENGAVAAVIIQSGGTGFTASSAVSFSGGGGTGATATITSVSPPSGNNPSCSTVYQQRRLYAGTKNLPTTAWGSRLGLLDNFNYSDNITAEDSYTLTFDFSRPVPIKHMVPQRNGVLLMHSQGIDKLSAAEGRAISALNFSLEPEVAIGVGAPRPAQINNDILFCNLTRTSVYALAYTFYSNSYAAQDVSVFASHLFGPRMECARMEWAEDPDKLLWVRREDGRFLSLTYARDQEVFGWAQHYTQGFVRDICVLDEGGVSVVYFLVQRLLNGVYRHCVERMSNNDFELVEDFVGSDSAVVNATPLIDSTASITYSDGTLFASGAVFGSVLVGDVLRAFGGKLAVTALNSSTSIDVEIIEPITDYIPGTEIVPTRATWQLYRPATVFSGLWHLEGENVSVLGDGSFYTLEVANGAITLPQACSSVIAGLSYKSEIVTLPLSVVEQMIVGALGRVVKADVRLIGTRGLEYGQFQSRLYEMKDRGVENFSQPPNLRTRIEPLSFSGQFVRDIQIRFRQKYALPSTVAGMTITLEVED